VTASPAPRSGHPATRKPRVLFVCVKNAGKSQMAAGLTRQIAGDAVDVRSAGTRPGTALNDLSVASLLEVGVDITGEHPKALTDEMVRAADVVVTLGPDARVDEVEGTEFQTWITDEPSEHGIDGIERMRLVRDDIATRVRVLARDLGAAPARPSGPATR
jgi:arsenate-mycothiol transferase